jgi:hypothetical protein
MAAELAVVHHKHSCKPLDCEPKSNVLYLMMQYEKNILQPYKIWSDYKWSLAPAL